MKWKADGGSGGTVQPTSTGDSITSSAGPNFARSLVICINAALACSDILEVQLKRAEEGVIFFPTQVSGAFASAVFLLAILYGTNANSGALGGVFIEPARAMRAVRVSLDVIGKMGKSWSVGKAAWDILNDLVSGYNALLPPTSLAPGEGYRQDRDDVHVRQGSCESGSSTAASRGLNEQEWAHRTFELSLPDDLHEIVSMRLDGIKTKIQSWDGQQYELAES